MPALVKTNPPRSKPSKPTRVQESQNSEPIRPQGPNPGIESTTTFKRSLLLQPTASIQPHPALQAQHYQGHYRPGLLYKFSTALNCHNDPNWGE